jgi:hypothetical protein
MSEEDKLDNINKIYVYTYNVANIINGFKRNIRKEKIKRLFPDE